MFSVEGEKAASHMHRITNFHQIYEYLGCSDGSTFKKVLKDETRLSKKQAVLMTMPDDKLSEEQLLEKMDLQEKEEEKPDIYKKAFDAELEVAKQNKVPPRDFSKMGRDGQPLNNTTINESLNMMK